jgi:signal transduction histidine kinase
MKNKNIFFTTILLIGILTYVFNYYASKANSGIRAYIKGESEYSKGQKDGLIYLFTYAQTGDTNFRTAFNKAIMIPISDNMARISMINEEADSTIKQKLVAGNNDPKDLDNMMWLFRSFRTNASLSKALAIWESSDTLINELYELGNQIQYSKEVMADSAREDETKQGQIKSITRISRRLSKSESEFSNMLSEAARCVNIYILIANIFAGLLLLTIVVIYAAGSIKRLRKSELKLKQSVEVIGNQNQRLVNFAYIVSHNIRSYSAHILAAVSLLEDALDEEEKTEIVQDMKVASDNFGETVAHLENLIAVQSQTEVNRETIDLNSYIDKCLNVIVTDVITTHAHIHNHIEPGTEIDYNPAYIESILLNLLINAVKYKHPERHPEIHISLSGSGNSTAMHIKDNGLGMDLHKYGHKLFGMYNTFHGNADARGLGLFIVKYQVEAMGGHIYAESEPGKGTTFTVMFAEKKHKK